MTIEEFAEHVRRCGVFSDARLKEYLDIQFSRGIRVPEKIAAGMVRAGHLSDYQARQILTGRTSGLLIAGKYRVLDLLGKGGMGSVFLCEHVRMKRLVAVKVLPQDRQTDNAALARFEREAQAIAAFDHPNVVHAYDIDQADGRHFLVMEFIDGVDLQTFVANHGPMPIDRAAWCVMQTARGLHHAWLAGWVHRDIKPGNLLIDRAGCVKILDMGLARISDSHSAQITSLFRETTILGTADYLSPEQCAGNNDVDIRADIYSLGATFYFLLTGSAPFEDVPVSQKLLGHRELKPMPLCLRRPQVPDALSDVIGRMMEKDPRNRFSTPEEVAELLTPFCPVPPPPPSELEMPKWSPLVAERIRASQAPNERVAPKTEPLHVDPTDLTLPAYTESKADQISAILLPIKKTVAVPRWVIFLVLLLLTGLVAWVVYRESRPARSVACPVDEFCLHISGPATASVCGATPCGAFRIIAA